MQISKSVYKEKHNEEFKNEDGLRNAWIMLLDVLVGEQEAAAFLSAMQKLGYEALTVSGPRFFWSDDGKEKAVEMSKDKDNNGHALEDQAIPKILDQFNSRNIWVFVCYFIDKIPCIVLTPIIN